MDNHQSKSKCAEAWPPQDRCLPETDDQPCPIVNGGNAQKSASEHERAGKKNGGREKETSILAAFTFPCRSLKSRKGGRWVGQTQLCPFLWLGSRGKTRSVVCKESDEREEGACRKECSRLGWPWTRMAKNKNVTVGRTAAIFEAKNIIMCYK